MTKVFAPVYTVKGVKTFTGMEGSGFNATLYRDGKKVAFVIDEGSGGSMIFHWEDHKERIKATLPDWEDKPREMTVTPEEKTLREHCATLPARDVGEGLGTIKTDMDIFLSGLVEDELARRRLERLTKTKTLAVLPDGKVYSWKIAFSEAAKAGILKRHPGARFLNEMPMAEAIKAMGAT